MPEPEGEIVNTHEDFGVNASMDTSLDLNQNQIQGPRENHEIELDSPEGNLKSPGSIAPETVTSSRYEESDILGA